MPLPQDIRPVFQDIQPDGGVAHIGQQNHHEELPEQGLRNIDDIRPGIGEDAGGFGNDAGAVVTDDRDDDAI